MKKLSIVAVICIIAMLFASCSQNVNEPPVELNAPGWAQGSYSASIMGILASLTIDESTFAIVTGIVNFDSSVEGVKLTHSEEKDGVWTVKLTGIPNELEGILSSTDEVSVTIEQGATEGHLSVSVTLPASEEFSKSLQNMDFTPVSEETPAV